MKKILALLLAVVMVLSLAACGSEAPAPAPTEAPAEQPAETLAEQPAEEPTAEPVEEYTGPDSFSMIDSFDITTLDYVYNNKSSNGDYTSNFIEGLLTQDNHGKLIAGMAKEWSSNDDASEWTFVIRDDAVWSTNAGEEYDAVVAEDFVTGLKHAADSQSETIGLVLDLIVGLREYYEGTGTWEDVGIKADGNTLTYTLTGPCGYFDGMTTYSILFPINAEFLESKGSEFGAVTPDSILYNGCYLLTSLVPAQEVRFEANPNYYDAANVFVKNVVVTYSDGSDPAQNFNMFVNGEVTSTTVNQSLPEIKAKADELYPDSQYISMTTATSYWGAFNWDRQMYTLYNDTSVSTTSKETDAQKADTKAAILNANFRRAVYAAYSAHAVEAIARGEDLADGAIRNTLVPYTFQTTSDGRSYGSIVEKYAAELVPEYEGINLNDGQDAWYNPELAVTFIEKAKEELGKDSFTFTLIYGNNEGDVIAKVAQAIKSQVEANLPGVTLNLQPMTKAERLDKMQNDNYDVALTRWGPDYADPMTYLGMWITNASNNYGFWSNAEYDQLIKDCTTGAYVVDYDARWDAMYKAETLVMQEAVIASLYTQANANLISSGVTGIDFHPVALNRVYKSAVIE